MRVTNKMINKDVRLIGSVLRPFTTNTTAARLRKHREGEKKKISKGLQTQTWGQPKNNNLERIELSRKNGTSMRVLVLTPAHEFRDVPALLWLHGGGLAVGYPEDEIGIMESLMAAVDCIVVSPDYTMSFDAPYPAALDDSYQTLLWTRDNAERLGANPSQLFVGGGSGGGGLTAALAIYARDKGEVNIAFQMPLFPMLDDRCDTASAQGNNAPMCDYSLLRVAWDLYLGSLAGGGDIPCYAAPARLEDFTGLAPAYSYAGSIDPLCDETKCYFDRLKAAGVPAHLDIYDGGFHGFETIGANKPIGKMAHQRLYEALRYAADNYFASNVLTSATPEIA